MPLARRARCWVAISVAGPAAPGGQLLVLAVCRRSILTWHHCGCQVGEEEGGAGREWQACPSSSPGHGAMPHMFSICRRRGECCCCLSMSYKCFLACLVTPTQQSSSPGWRPWSDGPYFLLRRRPLTTLSRPPPTAVAELQWGEPCLDASGTSACVAGSLSKWLALLPLVGNR